MECVIVFAIKFYQRALSPFIPHRCRFTPTCSHYFLQSVLSYGPIKGTFHGMKRICRCHPFHAGGYDPVDPRTKKEEKWKNDF
ncbi:MAG: membrane protein insertion efficiency factor YidD [Candidatus Omnitrophota bacterium]